MSDSRPIQFGNHISLKHNMTGRFLASVDGTFYENGSGQQVVACGGWEPSDETNFIVIPCDGEEIDGEVPINFGNKIRLEHSSTGTRLHSHSDFFSPITEQQEVTCYNGDSDANDIWIVEQWTFDEEENGVFDVEDTTWYAGRSFFLRHAETGATLHSHDEAFSDNKNEVTCYGEGPDENDRWRVV